MDFIAQIFFALIMLFGALLAAVRGRGTALFTAALVLGLMLVKGLPAAGMIVTLCIILLRVLLEKPLQSRGGGSFLNTFSGSVLLLVLLGVFFGPVTSLVAWLAISGIEVLPLFKGQVRGASLLTTLLFRGGTALGLLLLAIYAVYAG